MNALLWVSGAAAVAGALALDRLANAVVSPPPRELDRSVPDTGIAHEDLVIPSGDHGLRGWLLFPDGAALRDAARADERPLLLLVHGWGANYGGLLDLAEPLVAEGYEVLIFDVRGHGRSEEVPYVTIRHFRDDVIAASAYAAGRFPGRKRVLVGHSMGGAAAVLAVAEGAHADGIVMIAAPARVLEITADYLRSKGMPGRLMVAVLTPFWWRRARSTFRRLNPERRMHEVDAPVLVIQPELDRRVARSHGERLALAAGVPLHVIAGAGHTDVLGHAETHRLIVEFLETIG